MRWRMSHTLHLRASCFVPAFYMSMKSLGECTLYSCFLCVGYFSDLGHFGLETCFTVHCAIFAQFEWFFSYTQRDSQPSVEVLSVTVLYLALSAVEWPFDTAQGLQCAALLQLHRTSTKRGQSFLKASRVRASQQRMWVVQGWMWWWRLLCALLCTLFPGLSPASPDLVAFCCRGESISAGHLSPAVAVFPARVIPTDYVGSRLRGDRPRGHGRSRCTTAAITCSLIVHLDRDPMLTARWTILAMHVSAGVPLRTLYFPWSLCITPDLYKTV